MDMVGHKSPFSVFISDLHLCQTRPQIIQSFIHFTKTIAQKAENLFILGDFFEYWAGDDDSGNPPHPSIIDALSELSDQGTAIYFTHGNRDFLIGETFCSLSHMTLIQDPTKITLYGQEVLLSHGDCLCTDDVDYQAFRKLVRSPDWIANFLSIPLQERKNQIEKLRSESEQQKSLKSMSIMDVNQEAVNALLADYDYPNLLIHGHTHRPAVHDISIPGKKCQRIVLGDWYEQASYLILKPDGFELHTH
jgi:UDP-2,3-diacylglucosamine hydrolase